MRLSHLAFALPLLLPSMAFAAPQLQPLAGQSLQTGATTTLLEILVPVCVICIAVIIMQYVPATAPYAEAIGFALVSWVVSAQHLVLIGPGDRAWPLPAADRAAIVSTFFRSTAPPVVMLVVAAWPSTAAMVPP